MMPVYCTEHIGEPLGSRTNDILDELRGLILRLAANDLHQLTKTLILLSISSSSLFKLKLSSLLDTSFQNLLQLLRLYFRLFD